jgi:bifunctional NMN adenylyltransferase/nudix hydrolase
MEYIWLKNPDIPTIKQEYKMVKKYKEAWKAAPFPPTFMTVDAIVVQSGHILLVKRGDMPGKGLWALPGGFLNQEETMLDGAIRELKEETKIKVPVPVLKGSIKESKTFDAPNRSSRGRTITQAFFIDLGVGELPKVKGADDAEKAFWVPFNQVKQEKMFEDHFHIIDNFINIG